jgi:Fe-S-cluster containining protein
MRQENPCLHCGACCAYFRVSFYWGEAEKDQGGSVPSDLTEDVSQFFRCMQGTNQKKPRCIALGGQVGEKVACQIYADRPTPCRDFGVHWKNGFIQAGLGEMARCNKARSAWGLPKLAIDEKPGVNRVQHERHVYISKEPVFLHHRHHHH